MQKRGISHVEVILSFIIFAAAVGFGLYFFNPANPARLAESTLTYASREVMANTTIPLEVHPIIINNSGNQISSNRNSIVTIDISDVPGQYSVRVQNQSGSVLLSERRGGMIYTNASWNVGNDFISVLLSEDFSSGFSFGDPVPPLNQQYYSQITPTYEQIISERRFVDLATTYATNYTRLKKDFNLPNRVDFGVTLRFSDSDSIIAERNRTSSTDVYTSAERVKVLRRTGEIMFAELQVHVW